MPAGKEVGFTMDGSRMCRFLLPASVSDHSVNGLKIFLYIERFSFHCIALVPVHVIRNANSMWSSAG